jgi:hypothetical protein
MKVQLTIIVVSDISYIRLVIDNDHYFVRTFTRWKYTVT